jgi:F-type H+-transporting ATPase subunit delta
VTRRAAAKRYARALFDVALKETDVEKAYDDLQQFVDVTVRHPVLASIITNPAIPAAKKYGVAKALLDRSRTVSAPVAKLILLLAERDRLVLLPDVAAAYRERLLEHQNVVRGEVTSAMPLDQEKIRALEQGLARTTGRRVLLEPRVDPAIVGGAITRLGSTVFDGSVTTQLEKMKQSLIEGAQ